MSNVTTAPVASATEVSVRDSFGNSIAVDLIANKVIYAVHGTPKESKDLFLAGCGDWIYQLAVGSRFNRDQLGRVVAAAKARHNDLRVAFIADKQAAVAAAWVQIADSIQGPRWELIGDLGDFALDPVYFCGPDGKTTGWHVWANGGIFCDRNA